MENDHVRKIITDEIWNLLEPAIAAAKHSAAGAPPDQSEREFLEALLYLNRTGCPWRDVPVCFGKWLSVAMRFRRWEARGIWQRLWEGLQTERLLRSGSGPLSWGLNHQDSRRDLG